MNKESVRLTPRAACQRRSQLLLRLACVAFVGLGYLFSSSMERVRLCTSAAPGIAPGQTQDDSGSLARATPVVPCDAIRPDVRGNDPFLGFLLLRDASSCSLPPKSESADASLKKRAPRVVQRQTVFLSMRPLWRTSRPLC